MLDTFVVLAAVLLEQAGSFRISGRVGIGVAEQTLDGGENRGNIVDRTPVALQDIKANPPIVVHVGMEKLGHEFDKRGVCLGNLQRNRE